MAIYGFFLPILLFVYSTYCATEQACQYNVLEHYWQRIPQKLILRCIMYDLSLTMVIKTPKEKIGQCEFLPQVDCYLNTGIQNDTYSIEFRNCTPPELHVEVSGEWVDELEGNWTCQWGIQADSKCIATTLVKSPKPPQPLQKDLTQDDTKKTLTALVIVFGIIVVAVAIGVVICVIRKVIRRRKKKQKKTPTPNEYSKAHNDALDDMAKKNAAEQIALTSV